MTVSTTTYKIVHQGIGGEFDTDFAFNFRILDEDHLVVQIINNSGTLQAQTINVDYTVTGIGNDDAKTNYTSGTVSFVTAPLATDTIIIKRGTPLTQGVDYIENDNFPAETHEEALDKLTLQAQDMQEQLDRCFKLDYTGEEATDFTLPDPVANYYLRFNDDADGLEAVANTGTIGLDNVVEDPSPQLGGNLDVNGNNIVSASNGNIIVDPDGTGEIRLNAATVTVEDSIVHLGDTDTSIDFTTNAVDFQAGGSSIMDINASGLRIGATGSRITEIADEDDMTSNSDTKLASQQSIKAYVDTAALDADDPILEANLDTDGYDIVTTSANKDITIDPHGSGDVIITADTGGWIDLNSDIVYVGQNITHKGDTNNKITFGTDTQDIQTGGSSRLDVSDSGVRMGGANSRVTTILDEDAMGSDSATALATQQSIKAYVDNKSASQAEMEAATSTTVYASPGVAQYHPSAAKGYVVYDVSAQSILDSYNVSSVSRSGSTTYTITVNWDTDFSSADYTVAVYVGSNSLLANESSRNAGSYVITTANTVSELYIVAYGDQ